MEQKFTAEIGYELLSPYIKQATKGMPKATPSMADLINQTIMT
jgi:hypothetical protein